MALARALGIVSRDLLPHDKGRYLLNGVKLFDMGLSLGADGVQVGAVEPATDFLGISGRDGFLDNSLVSDLDVAFTESREITVSLLTSGLESDAIKSKMTLSTLAGKWVSLRDLMLPGEWRGRVTSVEWTDTRNMFGCYVFSEAELHMQCLPFLIGSPITMPKFSDSLTIRVEGNQPVYPKLTVTVNQRVSGNIVVDCSDGLEHDPTTTRVIKFVAQDGTWDQGQTITIDMDTMIADIGSQPYFGVSLDSDLWHLNSGMQTLTATSGVSVSVQYEPEWSI